MPLSRPPSPEADRKKLIVVADGNRIEGKKITVATNHLVAIVKKEDLTGK